MPTGVNIAGPGQSLDQSLNTILADFRLLRDDTGVMRSAATMMRLKPHEGSSKNILNFGRLQAFNVSDGVDIAQAQLLSDAVTSYTPSEVAVQTVLSGRTMRRVADPDLLSRTGRILNNAYDLKEDGDGITAIASFTGASTLGGAGVVASPGIIAAGTARLGTGDNRVTPEPAPGPYFAVIHNYAALPLWGRMIPLSGTPAGAAAYGANTGAHAGVTIAAGANDASMGILRQGPGTLGMVSGATIKVDANFTIDANDDFIGAIFSREGLIYVSEEEPRLDSDTSDKSMRGAVELNVWGSYVWGLYRPAAYGIPLQLDASTPTS